MKKILLLVFVFISTFGFSQQAIKHRESDTVMKYLTIANGNNPSIITGINNINHGASGSKSSALIRTASGIFISTSQTSIITTNIPNENVGSFVLSFYLSLETIRQTNTTILLTFTQKDGRVDTNNDGLYDGHYTVWILPISQTNGDPIPNETMLRLTTPVLTDLATGGTSVSTKDDWFSWNTSQQKWIDVSLDPIGGAENNNWVDWVTYLNVNNFIHTSELKVYPNPTNNFVTIQNEENVTENFKYKIVDLTGRIVKNGYSKFNEQINIESLTSGNYIIQIQTDSNQFITQKILKN